LFARFTDSARRVIWHSQQLASELNHERIGSEHLLVGLLMEPAGVAAKALAGADVSLDRARQGLLDLVRPGERVPKGHIPFSQDAKKVLELSLRQALRLDHNFIGTEHVLLALLDDPTCTGARVLMHCGVQLPRLRETVSELVSTYSGDDSDYATPAHPLLPASERRAEDCVLCGVQLASRDRSIRGLDGGICEHCVTRATELLAAQRAPSVVLHPSRFDAVVAVERAFAALFVNASSHAQLKVERVEVRDATADVRFHVLVEGLRFEFDGRSELVGDEWVVAPETIADVTRALQNPN